MTTVKNPAADKLYKKLMALRVTLPNDERAVFDQIIPAEEEVTAHRLARASRSRARAKARAKAPEVTGHKMAKTRASKASTKASTKAAAKAAAK